MGKKEKGIAIIALVVTIIVLLILGMVTIMMLEGSNDKLDKTSENIMKTIGNSKDSIALEAANLVEQWHENKNVDTGNGFATTAGEAILTNEVYKNVDTEKVEVSIDRTSEDEKNAGIITIKSKETGKDKKAYEVIGNVENNGGINWKDGSWVSQ